MKKVLVTGTNRGIGMETALAFAVLATRFLLPCETWKMQPNLCATANRNPCQFPSTNWM